MTSVVVQISRVLAVGAEGTVVLAVLTGRGTGETGDGGGRVNAIELVRTVAVIVCVITPDNERSLTGCAVAS